MLKCCVKWIAKAARLQSQCMNFLASSAFCPSTFLTSDFSKAYIFVPFVHAKLLNKKSFM